METSISVKPGDEVLIITDTQMAENIKNGLMAAAAEAGAEVQLFTMVARRVANQEVPALVGAAMSGADKIIALTSTSMNHTAAWKRAVDSRKMLMGLPMLTEDVIIRTWPTSIEEIVELKRRAIKMSSIVDSSKIATLRSPEGTDLTLEVGKYESFWDCGMVEGPGRTSLPAGQTATCPVEGTANGRYVVDVTTGFPDYRFVREPIACTVKDGNVISIEGGRDAEEFKKYLDGLEDPNVFHIAELGTGLNDKCKFTGNPHDDEKKAGSVRIAVGTDVSFGGHSKAKTHVDGIMSHVTLKLDDRTVVENGKLMI